MTPPVHPRPPRATRVACIDIGTVTARLAVADVAAGRVTRLDKRSTICDLGEGLSATGRILPAARARVAACVAAYVEAARAARAPLACCTLTSAARDAANAADLLADLAALGLAPQVIDGAVEGALTFAGVASDFVGVPVLVADNGGGSTELAIGLVPPAPATHVVAATPATEPVGQGCPRLGESCAPAGGRHGEAWATARAPRNAAESHSRTRRSAGEMDINHAVDGCLPVPVTAADGYLGKRHLSTQEEPDEPSIACITSRGVAPSAPANGPAPAPADPPAASAGPAYVESVDVGCRRVTERFLSATGPDTPAALAAVHAFVRELLAPACARALSALPAGARPTLVTCGGTVTSLVAIRDALVPYDPARVHLARLSRADAERLEAELAARTVAERAATPGLQPQRAAVIVGGAVCVAELLRAVGADELVVSEHDLLHGLALAAAAAADGAPGPLAWSPKLARLA